MCQPFAVQREHKTASPGGEARVAKAKPVFRGQLTSYPIGVSWENQALNTEEVHEPRIFCGNTIAVDVWPYCRRMFEVSESNGQHRRDIAISLQSFFGLSELLQRQKGIRSETEATGHPRGH